MKIIIKTSILLSFIFFSSQLMGQSALVKRATAETSDGLIFRVWAANLKVKDGKDIEVHYQVENRGSKSIYLITEDPIGTEIDGQRLLILPSYIWDEHMDRGNEYNLIEIKRKGKYEGKFVITKNDYKEARAWSIDVSFSFVRDKKGFNQRLVSSTEKRAIGNKTEVVGVGTLEVDVR